jgi:AcrR family transcriptional regulator
MARPISIQDHVVLEAARKVFLQHGYKATSAQVAREAGVSEGSLFKHFRTKTQLFLSAMQTETPRMAWHDRLLKSVGTGNVRALLELAGRQLLQRLQAIIPRIMMMRSSGITPPVDRRRIVEVHPMVYHVRILAKYFRGEIARGRLVMADPESQAHAFIGSLAHYVFCDTHFDYRPASATAYVRTVVDTTLRAAAPATGPVQKAAPRRRARRKRRDA